MDYARAASSSSGAQEIIVNSPVMSMSGSQTSQNNHSITSDPGQSGIPSSRNTEESINQHNTNQAYTPKRQNAIILDNIQDLPQDLCLRAVADVIGGRNIHYVTRLSAGRICMYLTNETHVNHLTKEGGVQIGSQFITVRRYVTDATKFIVSNCPPELSDDDLKKLLSPYGKIVSAPTRLKISTTHDDLKHIKTWRRSIYIITSHDSPKMPKRMLITSTDNVKQTLYIEKDEIVCTFCLTPGHTREKCKKLLNHDQDFPTIYQPAGHRLFNKPQQQPTRTISPPTTSIPITLQNSFMPIFNHSKTPPPSNEHPPESTSTLTIYGESVNQEIPSTSISQERNTPIEEAEETFSMDTAHREPQDSDQELEWSNLNVPEKVAVFASKQGKRSHSTDDDENDVSFLSESSSSSTSLTTKPKKKKNTKKKQQEALTAVLNQMKFQGACLQREDFNRFMCECRGKANSKTIAAKLTSQTNFGALIVQLNEGANLCMDFNLKRRFQRAAEALITPQE